MNTPSPLSPSGLTSSQPPFVLFQNAQLACAVHAYEGVGSLLVADGRIVAVGKTIAENLTPPETTVIDCRGLVLMPGLIDMRVFTGEPGMEYRETLASAADAAAAGGVTQFIVMPNTQPVIDEAAIVNFVLARARETAKVRISPMAAITKGLAGTLMSEIGMLQAAGAVAITDGTHAVANASVFRRVLSYAKDFNMLVVQHVEEPTLSGGVMHASETASRLGLAGIPAVAELIMLERDLRLVEATGARYHAAQLSCATSVSIMRQAKARGLPVTCGVSIHHLTLNEHDIGAYRSFLKLSPPLRSEDDRKALVAGIADGTIDVIVSAHDPQSADTKRFPFAEAAFGAIGLETMFAAALRLYHNGEVTLQRLIDALSTRPAAILGLEGGQLCAGAVADFILVDLHKNWVVEKHALHSLSKNTPLEGVALEGVVMESFVGGRSVYRHSTHAGLSSTPKSRNKP